VIRAAGRVPHCDRDAKLSAGAGRFFGNAAARARSRGSFCAGTAESRSNKALHVDRYTVASLGSFDWRSALGAVTASALIVHGSLDVISADSAREWAMALPNARFALLEGVGHFPYLESPERFYPLVNAFLVENRSA